MFSRIMFIAAILLACLLVLELIGVGLIGLTHISRHAMSNIAWLRDHDDDRGLLRPIIASWWMAVLTFLLTLIGAGKFRRLGFIVSASAIVGFPLAFFALVALSR